MYGGTLYCYDGVDVLYHNMCWDKMPFVPHQYSVMLHDAVLFSRDKLLLGCIFNPYLLYRGLGSNICCNIVVVVNRN